MTKRTNIGQPKADCFDRMPLTHSIQDVTQQLHCGRTKVYSEIRAGALEARKIGRRTIITDEALQRYVASLPTINPPIADID